MKPPERPPGVGIATHTSDRTLPPVELAKAVEERGFESLFMPDHSHIPVSRETPWPGSLTGEPLPEEYSRLLDPLVALGACVGVTDRLRLGTSVVLPAQRDPIQLAKEVATLDYLSGGRVVLGVGFGWNREEMRNHGVDFATRWDLVREKMLVMKALWTDEVASYAGREIRLAPSWAWPKPVQRPHPPILLGGGWGPRLLGAVCDWADGWMPVSARASLGGRVQLLHEAAERAGRDPATIQITVIGARPDVAAIRNLAAEGVSRVILSIPHSGPDAVRRHLDDWAPLVETLARG